MHGVSELTLDSKINKISQKYADELAKKNSGTSAKSLEHSQNKQYGENLYFECQPIDRIDLKSSFYFKFCIKIYN